MSDTKWADVAHYYSKSYIEIVTLRGSSPKTGRLVSMYQSDAITVLFGENRKMNRRKFSIVQLEWCKPILRHRDDMTEAEAREIWEIHFGKAYEIGPFNELEEPCKDEILNSATYGTRNRLNTELMLGNSLTLHWFISRGFDVFGLIESGQAIRKEMGNGNS